MLVWSGLVRHEPRNTTLQRLRNRSVARYVRDPVGATVRDAEAAEHSSSGVGAPRSTSNRWQRLKRDVDLSQRFEKLGRYPPFCSPRALRSTLHPFVADDRSPQAAPRHRITASTELHRALGEIVLKRDPANSAPVEEALPRPPSLSQQQGTRSFELRAALAAGQTLSIDRPPFIEAHGSHAGAR